MANNQKTPKVTTIKVLNTKKTYELSEQERLKILANLIIDKIMSDFRNNNLKTGV